MLGCVIWRWWHWQKGGIGRAEGIGLTMWKEGTWIYSTMGRRKIEENGKGRVLNFTGCQLTLEMQENI